MAAVRFSSGTPRSRSCRVFMVSLLNPIVCRPQDKGNRWEVRPRGLPPAFRSAIVKRAHSCGNSLMRCPICGVDNDKVIDSRASEDGFAIRRRRECMACQARYNTYERPEDPIKCPYCHSDSNRVVESECGEGGLRCAVSVSAWNAAGSTRPL